jgi:hypothetical protein
VEVLSPEELHEAVDPLAKEFLDAAQQHWEVLCAYTRRRVLGRNICYIPYAFQETWLISNWHAGIVQGSVRRTRAGWADHRPDFWLWPSSFEISPQSPPHSKGRL